MEKQRIQEIIVVEGKSDTIETNGSAINDEILIQIQLAQEKRGVIVLTDPDFPGEKIRKTIMAAVPMAKHAFISQEEGIPKGKGSLGIEHASDESILSALHHVVTPTTQTQKEEIPTQLLWQYGLIGGQGSRCRRERLGKLLRIGYTNSKQLQKRLKIFAISLADFEIAIKKVLKEEQEDGK